MRPLHRVLGLVLLIPFLLWTATGLMFLLKPGWTPAYEMLDAFQPTALDLGAVLPPAQMLRQAGIEGAPTRIELGQTALGPMYRVRLWEGGTALADARSGRLQSPVSEVQAKVIAESAAARASARERYGAVLRARTVSDAVEVEFAGGAVVTVGRSDLSVTQRGPDTDWIDRLYRIHYLQWTGHKGFDRALAISAIAATWVLSIVGALLFLRSSAQRRTRHPLR
jgi:hypothetical protein